MIKSKFVSRISKIATSLENDTYVVNGSNFLIHVVLKSDSMESLVRIKTIFYDKQIKFDDREKIFRTYDTACNFLESAILTDVIES